MGLFNHHQEPRITVDGQTVSVDKLVELYNQREQKIEDLQKQLVSHVADATILTVDGQKMTVDNVRDLIDQQRFAVEQEEATAAQLAALQDKNAELAKAAQNEQTLEFAGKQITMKELFDLYNGLLASYQDARNETHRLQIQQNEHAKSLMVNDQELTADDVQKLIDQRKAATEQVKAAADQIAELKSKNAELAKTVQSVQGLKIGGKPVTFDEVLKKYNEHLERLRKAIKQIKQLQDQLKEQSSSLTVNDQELTADDVQKLIDQREAATEQVKSVNAQLAELKDKNAQMAKIVQRVQGLTIGGKPATLDDVIKNYKEMVDRLRQAYQQIKQLKEQSSSLTVNDQELTADDVQKLIDQRDTATEQVKSANTQLKAKTQELAAAKQVTIDGKTMTVTELVKRYRYLLQQRQSSQPRTNSQPAPQPQRTQPARSSAVPVSNADREKLIDRYYQDVQSVLGDYQDQVEDLQQKLTKYLKGNGQAEFLQLAESKISANSYQKLFSERNKQMVRYIENHQYQEKLVRPEKQADNPHNELRGVDYWGNLIYRYRRALSRLLDLNKDVHHDFKYAYRYAKPTALRIGERKPSYLTDQNVLDLRTIYSGIKDEQDWHKTVDDFRDQAKTLLKGAEGERIVRNVVKSYAYNRVLTSLNLPYEYRKGKADSNQIDCIVVNQKGIFILEIKNYNADTLGIDRDGFVVYYKKDGTATRYHNIARQGQNHYKAVQRILESDETLKPHLRYLKKYMRVVYVSTNPHAKLKPAEPNAKPPYHFIGLDGLREYIDNTNGNLRPEIIQSVVDAIGNNQQAEKRYDHLCFPSDPVKRVDDVWQQLTVMNQLLKLRLDDFVDRYDPDVRRQLDMAGLVTRDGYVTSKPHHKKAEK